MRALGLLLILCVVGCEPSSPGNAHREVADSVTDTRPVVYTVNYPLAWMAERIAGGTIEVVFPAPPEVDPAHWLPDAETISGFQKADLVALNGAGYAAWLDYVSLSPGRVLDTSAHVGERLLKAEVADHVHGPSGEHAHGDVASHTWLDPTLATAQAHTLADSFTQLRVSKSETIKAQLNSLTDDLANLDQLLSAAFSAHAKAGILYSHPVYQYLDHRYALAGRTLVWEPHLFPSDEQWRALREILDQEPAGTMLWEAEPLPKTRAELQALGIQSIVFAHGANRPAHGDYMALMRSNLNSLKVQ